jgi:hypothetical protein
MSRSCRPLGRFDDQPYSKSSHTMLSVAGLMQLQPPPALVWYSAPTVPTVSQSTELTRPTVCA